MKNYTYTAIASFLASKAVAVALAEHHVGPAMAKVVADAIDCGDDAIETLQAHLEWRQFDTRVWVYVESADWGDVVVNVDNGGSAFKLSCVVHRDGGDNGPSKRVTIEV